MNPGHPLMVFPLEKFFGQRVLPTKTVNFAKLIYLLLRLTKSENVEGFVILSLEQIIK